MGDTSRYSKLINELTENRNRLRDDVLPKIINFRDQLDRLLPETKDFKNRFAIEQKMKTLTEVISAELTVRKHMDDSIKTEFDLVRKASGEDASEMNISKIAEAIESMGGLTDIDEIIDDSEESK